MGWKAVSAERPRGEFQLEVRNCQRTPGVSAGSSSAPSFVIYLHDRADHPHKVTGNRHVTLWGYAAGEMASRSSCSSANGSPNILVRDNPMHYWLMADLESSFAEKDLWVL